MKRLFSPQNKKSSPLSFLFRFTFLRLFVLVFFLSSFVFGNSIARITSTNSLYTLHAASTENWGLSFPEEGKLPQTNTTIEELKKYDAYFAEDTEEKKIYLTFDAGYENGCTPQILDALKKHHVPAAFFVVGTYIEKEPDLIKRMYDEGHIVANHTYHHPDMSQISSVNDFLAELNQTEELYFEVTGQPMLKFYRPPQGIYNENNLIMAKDLGYHTFFWSVAYVDWMQDQQPTHQEAFNKLLKRIHPGAIVLLHTTSKTNAEILDELLTKWKEMGYTFHSLEELTVE